MVYVLVYAHFSLKLAHDTLSLCFITQLFGLFWATKIRVCFLFCTIYTFNFFLLQTRNRKWTCAVINISRMKLAEVPQYLVQKE